MQRVGVLGIVFVLSSSAVIGLAPATAVAGTVCGTVEEFNAAMAADATTSSDVTLTFDVVGVNPADFFNTKGSLAQFRNTTCAGGADAGIKVYGNSEPLNEAHPPGTLKLEYGNSCCGGECGENWADPNASAVIFVDGTETCTVTMWMNPTEVGYDLACNVGTFPALGENPEGNVVDRIELLRFVVPDGGTTWELPNATATNDEVCWIATPSTEMSITVPVVEDVTTGPSWPNAVFPDVNDLAVESDGTQAYLKFEVPPIEGAVTSVRLSMTTGGPSSDGDGGEVHVVADSSWSESTLVWNARPAFDAASLGRIGPAGADVLVSLDLGPVIDSAGGTYSFAVFSPPTDGNGTHFLSKEGSAADAASLRISYTVVDADGDGTPGGPDCNDADAGIGPGADELCDNDVDDDCDGETDEGCPGEADESGDGTAGDGGSGASDGTGVGGEDGFVSGPGLGGGDGVAGCACTTSRTGSTGLGGLGALGMLVLGLGLARRRRSPWSR
jgi:MYXO-CTERM domain-containing protein